MSADKFTPGPWTWDAGDVGNEHHVRYCDVYTDDGTEVLIAEVNDCIPEGHANARILALAPTMLSALIGVRGALAMLEGSLQHGDFQSAMTITVQLIEKTEPLIAKAEGR